MNMAAQYEIARLRLAVALAKYNPSQPRDRFGRWTIGGTAIGGVPPVVSSFQQRMGLEEPQITASGVRAGAVEVSFNTILDNAQAQFTHPEMSRADTYPGESRMHMIRDASGYMPAQRALGRVGKNAPEYQKVVSDTYTAIRTATDELERQGLIDPLVAFEIHGAMSKWTLSRIRRFENDG